MSHCAHKSVQSVAQSVKIASRVVRLRKCSANPQVYTRIKIGLHLEIHVDCFLDTHWRKKLCGILFLAANYGP